MVRFPLLGRLSIREYLVLVVGCLFIAFESLLRIAIFLLPKPIITWFYNKSRLFFHFSGPSPSRFKSKENRMSQKILHARDFEDICRIHGYVHEEHVCLTKDGYLLGLHRLPSKKGMQKTNPGTSTGKPVVYLHHGLLMNSEIWVCLTDAERALPFVLVEMGYDVWLGNNRGNKYSKKSLNYSPNSSKFWDFSIDDFAWHDIPDSIEYILSTTKVNKVSYIGFSQGTAQAFAALSIHPQLNEKVNVFIALAPAMSPPGLAAPIVDGLMKASPTLLFLIFGRKSILSSAIMWQSILYPPIFTKVIDISLSFLFDWQNKDISEPQKIAGYAHLYSYASTKAVVHWFQIMRYGEFVMFDDDAAGMMPALRNTAPIDDEDSGSRRQASHGRRNYAYRPARFPTRNIVTPIVLLYGDKDSLVDINVMLSQLPQLSPEHSHVTAKCLKGYEHLDILWGSNVHKDVIPEVLKSLRKYNTSINGIEEGEGIKANVDMDKEDAIVSVQAGETTDFTSVSD